MRPKQSLSSIAKVILLLSFSIFSWAEQTSEFEREMNYLQRLKAQKAQLIQMRDLKNAKAPQHETKRPLIRTNYKKVVAEKLPKQPPKRPLIQTNYKKVALKSELPKKQTKKPLTRNKKTPVVDEPIITGNCKTLKATIDLTRQKMTVYNGEKLLYEWKVSTARKGYVTPVGSYKPYFLTKMHYSKKYDNSPMPHSIFFKGGYAIHGTDAVWRLGKRASHGCIRLHPQNAHKLYTLVQKYGKDMTSISITH